MTIVAGKAGVAGIAAAGAPQRGALSNFEPYCNADNGLVADTSRDGSNCSIAVMGFALPCYPIAVERGCMSRDLAVARTLLTLRFFWNCTQSADTDATGCQGFCYHFLDMRTGRLAVRGMLRARSRPVGDDDRELSLRFNLEADARLSVHPLWPAASRLHRRLAVGRPGWLGSFRSYRSRANADQSSDASTLVGQLRASSCCERKST